MKVLITGANGYIGKYVCDCMECCGIEYVRSGRKDFEYLDVASIRHFFKNKGITHVIHLASIVEGSIDAVFEVNIEGLLNLLSVCAEEKISHFLFASSNTVYAQNTLDSRTENICPEPQGAYPLSKYVGELMVADYMTKHNISYANVRIGDVFGPRQKYGNLLKAIINNIRLGKPLGLYGQGERTRDYIFIEDVAEGLVHICTKELQGNVNLATGKGTSVKELLDITNSLFENTLVINKVFVEKEDVSKVVLDVSKLRESGFEMKFTVEDGLRKILFEEIAEYERSKNNGKIS